MNKIVIEDSVKVTDIKRWIFTHIIERYIDGIEVVYGEARIRYRIHFR